MISTLRRGCRRPRPCTRCPDTLESSTERIASSRELGLVETNGRHDGDPRHGWSFGIASGSSGVASSHGQPTRPASAFGRSLSVGHRMSIPLRARASSVCASDVKAGRVPGRPASGTGDRAGDFGGGSLPRLVFRRRKGTGASAIDLVVNSFERRTGRPSPWGVFPGSRRRTAGPLRGESRSSTRRRSRRRTGPSRGLALPRRDRRLCSRSGPTWNAPCRSAASLPAELGGSRTTRTAPSSPGRPVVPMASRLDLGVPIEEHGAPSSVTATRAQSE